MGGDSLCSVLAEIVPDSSLDDVPVIETPSMSLRFKVTDHCSWNCVFCHKEGGWDNMVTAGWGDDDKRVFEKFKDHGYNEVHFTGGEPTLVPTLPTMIRGLSDMGYSVKSTSILAGKPDFLRECADNGLRGVNVSVHADFSGVDLQSGTVPDDIVEAIVRLQIGRNSDQVRKQILSLVRGIYVLKQTNVKIKVNSVISSADDLSKAANVYSYAKNLGLGLRFLPDLTPQKRPASYAAISSFLKSIGATLTSVKTAKGCSDAGAMLVDPDGYKFGVKFIDDVFLNSMCPGCVTQANGDCTEKFYGIRLEKTTDASSPYYVRLCLHEQVGNVVMPLDKFWGSPQFAEILERSI